MRRSIRIAVAGCLLIVLNWIPAAWAGQPNVVLILADDLGWGDVGCYNSAGKIPTPNLDRLAHQGLRFTDAHASSGVCVPSRFSLMTGLHAFRMANPAHPEVELRTRYGGNQATQPLVAAGCRTLPGILAAAGYATSMIGKWHLGFDDLLRRPVEPLRGGPTDRGFERYFGIPSSLDIDPYVFIEGDRIVEQASRSMPAHASPGWPDNRMGEFWRAGSAAPGFRHADVLPKLTARAESELKRLASEPAQRPFFLYVALPAPHSPLLPSAEFLGRTSIGIYGDYVAQTDDAIGRLVRTLDELAVTKETLLIVTSDNGPFWYPANVEHAGHSAAGPWRGMKGDAWEGGHRIPLLVRWPGHAPAGATSDALVSQTDFLATIANLAGIPYDVTWSDGADFSRVLGENGWARPAPRPLVARSSRGSHVLRIGPWKFIDRLGSGGFSSPQQEKPVPGGPTVQLYDLASDPGETRNLAARDAPRVRRFEEQLANLLGSKSPARP